MNGPLFEIDTKATCLLCFSPNCPPTVEKGREEGDQLNFDKWNATTCGFRVLLRYLKVDFTKLMNHFSTDSFLRRLYVKSSQGNLSVSLCHECSSVTNDFFDLFQVFENIRIQLDLCVEQLHEFIETGKKDEERIRKYRERMSAGNTGDLVLVQSSIAEELRSEVQKKCSLKLERSLPRIMVTKCQNSCGIRPNEESGSQQGSRISGLTSKEPAEAKARIPTCITTPVPSKSGVKRNKFLGLIAKFKARAVKNKEKNLVDFRKRMQLRSSQSQSFHLYSEINGRQQPRKCFECDKMFNHRGLLERHRMINHTMDHFGGRIPPSISESRLESTLTHFMDKVQDAELASLQNGSKTAGKCPCPFCKRGIHCTKRSTLRYHFLLRHFSNIIEHAGKQIDTTSVDNERNLEETPTGRRRRRSGTTLNCEHCGRTFKSTFNLRRHLISDHPFNFFKHRLPEEVSEEGLEKGLSSMMKKFELTHGLGFSFICSMCGKECRNRFTTRMHLLLAHFKQVVGNSVPITSTSASALITKSESEPVVAFEVIPGLKTEHNQNELLNVENMDEEITITAPFVVKVDPNRVDVEMGTDPQTESKKCGKLKTIVCTICGKVFANQKNRRQHNRRVHLRIGSNCKRDTPGKCEFCGKIYSQRQYLLRHKLQVHPIEFLKDNLPAEVTKQQLTESMECILEDKRQLSIENEAKNRNVVECPFCDVKKSEKVPLKIHLLHRHLEKVVDKIGEQQSQPKLRTSLAPGAQKCEHCIKYVAFGSGNLRKHLMQEHPLILFKDRLPQGISEQDFEEAIRRVQAAMKVLPKNRNDRIHFMECTLCSKKVRKEARDSRFHVLSCHLDQVVRKVEKILEGEPLSPEIILPD